MPTFEPLLDSSAAPWGKGTVDELRVIARLRAGDEDVFVEAVDRYHGVLTRVARCCVSPRAEADVVVRESWEQVIASLDGAQAWRSLRIELLRALMVRIQLRSEMLASAASSDPSRRAPSNIRIEICELLAQSVAALPTDQRDVVVLRDVSGLSASEVCDILDLAEPEQRRLLHRGRTTLGAVLNEAVRSPSGRSSDGG
jgi:DNA-directed RNA polymerase specialized sigma24 family protein